MRRRSMESRSFTLTIAAVLVCAGIKVSHAQQQVHCFSLEFFYDSQVNDAAELRTALVDYAAERTGLKLRFRDINDEGEDVRKRLDQIAKYFRLSEVKLPAIYGLNSVLAESEFRRSKSGAVWIRPSLSLPTCGTVVLTARQRKHFSTRTVLAIRP